MMMVMFSKLREKRVLIQLRKQNERTLPPDFILYSKYFGMFLKRN